jgi:hypothetical protein
MPCCGGPRLDHEENAETGKSQVIGERLETRAQGNLVRSEYQSQVCRTDFGRT